MLQFLSESNSMSSCSLNRKKTRRAQKPVASLGALMIPIVSIVLPFFGLAKFIFRIPLQWRL